MVIVVRTDLLHQFIINTVKGNVDANDLEGLEHNQDTWL